MMKTTKAHAAVKASRGTDASQTLTVDLFNNGIRLATANVGPDGRWSATLSGLQVGTQSLSARSDSATSNTYGFSIIEATRPLILDETPVTLQGIVYLVRSEPPTLPASSTVTRTASGGAPPYTYTSSNSAIAVVNTAGLVSPRNNGSVVVTVRDTAGQSKSFTVTVRNVFRVNWIGKYIHSGALGYQLPGGHLPSRAELTAIGNQYAGHWPIDQTHFWSSEKQPGILDSYYARLMPTGPEQTFLGAVPVETFSIVPATLANSRGKL
jgi:hypothetical protein